MLKITETLSNQTHFALKKNCFDLNISAFKPEKDAMY